MSKKSRKVKTKVKAVQPVAGTGAGSLPASAISKRVAPATAAMVYQSKNYDYVKSDLVRIGIIAGALILVLVILTFVPALKT